MLPLTDGKEHGQLKERMMAMEMKVEHESGIRPKKQDSGSLSDAFLLFGDYTECFFILFLLWDAEPPGKKAEMCSNRWEDQNLVSIPIYTSVLAARLASYNEEKTLRAIHPSYYSVPYI